MKALCEGHLKGVRCDPQAELIGCLITPNVAFSSLDAQVIYSCAQRNRHTTSRHSRVDFEVYVWGPLTTVSVANLYDDMDPMRFEARLFYSR